MVDQESTPEVLEALTDLAMPVVVVGATVAGERSCATGTMAYVSIEPPRVSTPLNHRSHTYELLRTAGVFSLSLLAGTQGSLAAAASRTHVGQDKFSELDIPVVEREGVPAVAGAAVIYWCELEHDIDIGTTSICVGRVVEAESSDAVPLLRYQRGYHVLGDNVDLRDESSYPL